MIRLPWAASVLLLAPAPAIAVPCAEPAAPCAEPVAGALPLIRGGVPVAVIADQPDTAVRRAARALADDLARVGGGEARLLEAASGPLPAAVIVGVVGGGGAVDRIAATGRLDLSGVGGRWEAYSVQLVERPLPGIARALVVAGADRRGAAFGAYDLSRRAGVSPWTWWADVPVPRRRELWATPGRRVEAPGVRYRGIFLNDEAPALDGWVKATFGGYDHRFYERVFDLVLRLKGNFLWPAMWGKSLWDDDARSAALANEMGVVLGTSHHEPMVRAHVEWERHGTGPWDYVRNPEALRAFWRRGIERMGANETLVTVGMRGDGDEPMTEGTATDLLARIVADQRRIIADATGRPAADTPQVWALYKEVQDYYDRGLRVPDDVTLLFSDDNWGNIRRLPDPGEGPRKGGYGVYYHFDYVGGPRNYKWLNTNQIARTWEQMARAFAHGADRLWVVNVGDLKPMELPTSFFLDMAWAPDRWSADRMAAYPHAWAAEQFGPGPAASAGRLLTGYTRLLSRRKPELLDADTYDLPGGELDRVLAEWDALEREARATGATVGRPHEDAWFELVEHPILAGANLQRLYAAVARNRLYAAQGRAEADRWAAEAERLFAKDAAIRRRYEREIAGGRWTSMMAQTHIGYTGWQQPDRDAMPALVRRPPTTGAALGVAIPGRRDAIRSGGRATLGTATPLGAPASFELFDRGRAPLRYRIVAGHEAVRPSVTAGTTTGTVRVTLSVDWRKLPAGTTGVPVTVSGSDGQVALTLPLDPALPPAGSGAVETDGVVAVEAARFARSGTADGLAWQVVPGLGRTGDGVTARPFAAPARVAGRGGSWLDYPVWLRAPGPMTLEVIAAPSLDLDGKRRLRFAVSVDDGPPQTLDLLAGEDQASWGRAVAANARAARVTLRFDRAGAHRVRLWRVDPGVVFQRLHLFRGAPPPDYLGPPASPIR